MKRNHVVLIRRLLAYGLAANLAVQPAFAQVTVSQLPLASAGGNNILPNLLFTLDNSGSMAWQFVPDYVDPTTVFTVSGSNSAPNNPCMTTGAGSTICVEGDPPYSAGGEFAMNGVGYDPNFSYLAGIDSNGQPHVNPPSGTLTPTATPKDAYTAASGTIDVTSAIPDRRYCNSNNVCMRNGQTDSASPASPGAPAGIPGLTRVSGTDDSGHAMSAGQFPYRTNKSNASFNVVGGAQTMVFGLPEMMPIGSFTRAGSTVTATTVEAHGLTTSDKVFVTSGTGGLSVTCVPVASTTNANTFTYTSGSSGTITATSASYRKCDTGNFARSSGTVTVTTSGNHGLVVNDIVTTFVPTSSAMSVTSASVTAVTATTFTYAVNGGTITSTAGFWVRNGLYNVTSTITGPALAYRIVPVEWCTDAALTDCNEYAPPATPPADHPFPAYVRFCRTQEEALAHGAVTFIATTPQTNRCQLKYLNVTGLQTYQFPRYGWFIRDTIKSTVASYGGRPLRVECAAPPSCTYTEEIQNYAKWYAYYRTRMQMMKTSVGISFRGFISNPTGTPPKPDSLRVGLITIHAADSGSVAAAQYLRIDNFNTTNANNFYTKFYQQTPGAFTPLREALSRAGWIFAGKLGTGLTAGIPAADDPIQSSCQKNYSLLTTDGFWNSNAGQDIAGAAMGNWDNIDNQLYTPAGVTPAYIDPVSSRATGTCNWPAPQQDQQSALDDLWHAAVNGRGTYFLALNPRTLANALQNALANIAGRNSSAAAAATSSPNITPKDNFAFSTTYQTNTWSGIVKAQRLDAVTGAVLKDAQGKPIILWQADQQLLTQVGASTDTRNILMLDTTAPTKLKAFQFATMTPAEQAFFMNKCTAMSQCSLLTLAQKTVVNAGTALIGFLRGQTGNEAVLFRDRVETDPVTNATVQTVLGDIVDATPAFIRVPLFNYTDTGYSTFKSANDNRAGALYVAANDGLLHSFVNAPH